MDFGGRGGIRRRLLDFSARCPSIAFVESSASSTSSMTSRPSLLSVKDANHLFLKNPLPRFSPIPSQSWSLVLIARHHPRRPATHSSTDDDDGMLPLPLPKLALFAHRTKLASHRHARNALDAATRGWTLAAANQTEGLAVLTPARRFMKSAATSFSSRAEANFRRYGNNSSSHNNNNNAFNTSTLHDDDDASSFTRRWNFARRLSTFSPMDASDHNKAGTKTSTSKATIIDNTASSSKDTEKKISTGDPSAEFSTGTKPPSRLQVLWKQYGMVFLVYYGSVYLMTLGSMFELVSTGIISPAGAIDAIKQAGLENYLDVEKINSTAGNFALAWILAKFTEPLRLALVVSTTPTLARYLGRAPQKVKKKKKTTTPPV